MNPRIPYELKATIYDMRGTRVVGKASGTRDEIWLQAKAMTLYPIIDFGAAYAAAVESYSIEGVRNVQ